jgi:hypothetical protein
VGFLRWLVPEGPEALSFLRWVDTRTLPFPGEAERTCDTVADLEDTAVGLRYALLLEFLTEPEAAMFGLVLEYATRLWREARPEPQADSRFEVVIAVVCLTGRNRTAREMRLATTPWHLRLEPIERNLADEDASATLAAMTAGLLSLVLLPFIPLMCDGTEPGIKERWKQVAQTEPDSRRRSDYAGLTLVFAELARAPHLWRNALEGWNVRQSMQVLEWQAEAEKRGEERGEQRGREIGRVEGKAEALLRLLEKRFRRKPPAAIVQRIQATTDLAQLETWFDAAITIGSMKEFKDLLAAK